MTWVYRRNNHNSKDKTTPMKHKLNQTKKKNPKNINNKKSTNPPPIIILHNPNCPKNK